MANGEPRPAPVPGSPPDRLESWKAIAAYLHRDVTTVQRWEKHEGLPVHRLPHQKLGSVYALKSEIDAWRDRTRAADRRGPWRARASIIIGLALIVVLLVAVVRAPLTRWFRTASGAPAAVPRTDFSGIEVAPLMTDLGDEAEPALSPDGRSVAFVSDKRGRHRDYDLYVKQIDGGEPVRVAMCDASADCFSPAWSPDGQHLAFLKHFPGEPPDGASGVFLMPALGGPQRRIGTALAREGKLSWFPDGGTLALVTEDSATGKRRISLLSVTTGALRAFSDPPDGTYDVEPAVSPDGRTIAFLRRPIDRATAIVLTQGLTATKPTQLDAGEPAIGAIEWVADSSALFATAGGKLLRVPVGGGPAVRLPVEARVGAFSVSRTGDRLVLVSNTTQRDIWRASGPAALTRTYPERLPFSSTRDDVRATYSPDGHHIAFVTKRSGRSEVWICDVDGSKCGPVPVSAPFEGQDRPAWAPDSRHLLFEGTLTGQPSFFYMFDLAEGTSRKLSACPPDSRNAVWSQDGAHLYFSADEALKLGVWKAAIDGSGQATRILDDRNFIPVAQEPGYLYLARFAGITPQQLAMTMWRVSLTAGRKEQIPGEVWSRYAVWRGRIVAVEQHDGGSRSTLVLIDPGTHARRVLGELGPYALQPAVSPDGQWVLFTRIEAERDLLLVNLNGTR